MKLLILLVLSLAGTVAAQSQPTYLSYLDYKLGMSMNDAIKAPLPPFLSFTRSVGVVDPDGWACYDMAVKAGYKRTGDVGVVETCHRMLGSPSRTDKNYISLHFLNGRLVGLYMAFDKDDFDGIQQALSRKFRGLQPSIERLTYTNTFGGVFVGKQITYYLKQAGVGNTSLRLQEVNDRIDESQLTLYDDIKMKAYSDVVTVFKAPPV